MQVQPDDFPRLMASLGENTRTVIPFHFLIRRRAQVWADDDWANVVIQTETSEPVAFIFGDDAEWQAELISRLPCMRLYWCPDETVDSLLEPVGTVYGEEAMLEPGIQRTVDDHVHISPPDEVQLRRLARADLPLLEHCSPDLMWLRNSWLSWEELLEDGIVIAALAEGQLVSAAVPYARAAWLEDIGVATDPAYQSRGLSSACAAMMVGELFAAGRQPVWSVFLSNTPSLRISEKLQFVTQTQCTAIRRRPED